MIDVSNWPDETDKEKPMPEIIECKGTRNLRNMFFAMCRGAFELKDHKPKEGDRYLHFSGKIVIVSSYCIQVPDSQGRIYFAIPPKLTAIDFDETKPDFESITIRKQEFEKYSLNYWTWLPRIEQFQEMLQPLSTMTMLHLFYGFVQQGKNCWHSFKNAPLPDPTMEQLWMNFTWSQLYVKIWRGSRGWAKC